MNLRVLRTFVICCNKRFRCITLKISACVADLVIRLASYRIADRVHQATADQGWVVIIASVRSWQHYENKIADRRHALEQATDERHLLV